MSASKRVDPAIPRVSLRPTIAPGPSLAGLRSTTTLRPSCVRRLHGNESLALKVREPEGYGPNSACCAERVGPEVSRHGNPCVDSDVIACGCPQRAFARPVGSSGLRSAL